MNYDLRGKSVLVTAGSQGIGFACARGFSDEGARVTICGRGEEALAAAAALIPNCIAVQGDVTDPADIARVVAAAGPIEVLINNAGGPPAGPLDQLTDEDWVKAFELTLMSAVRTTRLVLPHMRAKRWGRIITVSSFGVKQPVPGLTLSNSLRLATLGWAKTLSREVGGDNVTVNTVCPGWTETVRVTALLEQQADTPGGVEEALASIVERIPLKRLGQPHEIANLVVFLASEAASYITGTAIQVDGGIVEGYA